ncbi:MAG TPA: phosphoribosylglycinamide formyltransferase [Proteiniclasticum sp.]|uniref:formyltransferase family protein n=1 Tax=Proteiniclasticum sp. TaxID=2053595 RepID=UPI000E7DC318|nr:formyltransferase family protein [Proteiniclasticum sp.]HBW14446.1 phosphoribosylglycinamide formyltransferase [Proteiniclasticum sp.]
MFQVAVLISGKGSTLEAILKDQKRDSLYEVSLVLADRPCEGLRYAEMEGIRTKILPRDQNLSGRILEEVCAFDLVVLAGFLSILEGPVLTQMSSRIINLHPSLLPKFGGKGMYGMRVHEKVLESKLPISGCTVHYVSEVVDGGSILLQRIVGIRECHTSDDVMKKVSAVEKGALIDAIRLLAKEERINESVTECL